jgi:hypothetical protein
MAGRDIWPSCRHQAILGQLAHIRANLSLALTIYPKTENEGVALANDSKYGLGAGIWTSDLSRAHRVAADIESGLCWVNTHHRNDPSSPW